MKIHLDVLRRFIHLPADPAAARLLLDEVGVEVKRIDLSAPGVPMTLELLANRGDHHCYGGVAREVGGRTGGQPCLPSGDSLTVGTSPHPIAVETPLCPVYTLTRLDLQAEGQLDAEAAELLASAGLASKGAVIDATNVANLELGQPTHAFDAATIVGPVTVRLSRDGEKAWPLFAAGPVDLPVGTLVIADDEKVLAVAGVIGCEESKTTPQTTSVLLESAGFDPVAVRKASRALGIHTDSSARFERGSDFAMPVVGAGRVARLLRAAGWQVVGETGVVSSWRDPLRVIPFDPAVARAFLAIEEDDATLVARLQRYGFRTAPSTDIDPVSGLQRHPERLDVLVPTWRLWDVETPADLYEELAKSVGYDQTGIGLPPIDMGALPSPAEQTRMAVEQVLLGHGFMEVITDGFYGRPMRERLGVGEDHPLFVHVETANALDRAYSLLKNNTFGQAVECVATNLAVRQDEIKAFELTRTFHPDATAPNGLCTERRVWWAIASGSERPRTWAGASRPADAAFLKGVVAELATALKLPLRFAPVPPHHPLADLLHPGRRLAVVLDDAVIGVLGEVHPSVLTGFKIKRARPCYLEIDADALVRAPSTVRYEEPPSRPVAQRDLAFTLPHGFAAAKVAEVLRAAGPSWLSRVDIVDRFEHEDDGRPVVTWTYTLIFSSEAGDRTADEMNATAEALIAAVSGAWAADGVKLRA